jgi:hypothetical protein
MKTEDFKDYSKNLIEADLAAMRKNTKFLVQLRSTG